MKRVLLFACLSMSLGNAACEKHSAGDPLNTLVDYSKPFTPQEARVVETVPPPGPSTTTVTTPRQLKEQTMALLTRDERMGPHHFWDFGPRYRNATLQELLFFTYHHREKMVSGEVDDQEKPVYKDVCALGTSFPSSYGPKTREYAFIRNGARLGYHIAPSCEWKLVVKK